MKLKVLDKSGKETGREVSLSKDVFAIEPNDHAIYLDVKQYLANQRQGTHKTKEKAEITGSTRKLKRQKGTGTARAGSIKSPVFRGGGRIFGPKPRTYDSKLNKKVKALARKSALTHKAKDKNISVLEPLKIKEPKTKEILALLSKLALSDKKTLFVLPELDANVVLSARNIKKSNVTTVAQLNTYDVLNAEQLIIAEDSVKKIEELLG